MASHAVPLITDRPGGLLCDHVMCDERAEGFLGLWVRAGVCLDVELCALHVGKALAGEWLLLRTGNGTVASMAEPEAKN